MSLSHATFCSFPLVPGHKDDPCPGCPSVEASVTRLREQMLPNCTANLFPWAPWELRRRSTRGARPALRPGHSRSAATALQRRRPCWRLGRERPASVRAASTGSAVPPSPRTLARPRSLPPRLPKPRECAWLPRLDRLWTDRCALSTGTSTAARNVRDLLGPPRVQVGRCQSDKGRSKQQRRGKPNGKEARGRLPAGCLSWVCCKSTRGQSPRHSCARDPNAGDAM